MTKNQGGGLGIVSRLAKETVYFRFVGGTPARMSEAMKEIVKQVGPDVHFAVEGLFRQNGGSPENIAPFIVPGTMAISKSEDVLIQALLSRSDFQSF